MSDASAMLANIQAPHSYLLLPWLQKPGGAARSIRVLADHLERHPKAPEGGR